MSHGPKAGQASDQASRGWPGRCWQHWGHVISKTRHTAVRHAKSHPAPPDTNPGRSRPKCPVPTCQDSQACKRSAVRARLAPPGQKRNSNESNRQYSRKATAAEWAAVRVFGSGVFLRARLLAGQRIPDADPALPACHLRKSPCHRSRDSCRRVTTGSPEGPFLPATVAAFASSPAALAILVVRVYSQEPRLLARAARSLTARSARGLRCVAPMVSLRRWARWGAALFRRRDAPWRSPARLPARRPRNQARDAAQRT